MATVITLHGRLRKLRAELRETASQDSEQLQAMLQLAAAIEFLQFDAEIRATNSAQPLLKLFQAMQDLCAGHKPPFFFEAPRPDDVVTKPKISSVHIPQAALAIGYAALRERGRYKAAAARQWFDKKLREHKRPERGQDVEGWYRQVKASNGRPASALVEAFKSFEPDLAKLNGAAAAEIYAESWINTTCNWVGQSSLKLRTKTD
jgi:hypothetical protein